MNSLPDRHSESVPGMRLTDALRFRFTVIGALMMREIHTRYGRENIGFFWLFGEPLLFCLGVTLLWSAIRSPYDHGVPLVAFILTGYGPLLMWRHATQRAIHCFRANASLLYHRQIGVMDLLISRVLLEAAGSIASFFAVGLLFYLFGLYQPPVDLWFFYLGWLYMFLFTLGCSIVFACASERHDWVEKVMGPISYLMVPLSGFVFMVDWLPSAARKWALTIPTVHAFEMIRRGQFGEAAHTYYDIAYISFFCFALIAVGLSMTTTVRQHIAVE